MSGNVSVTYTDKDGKTEVKAVLIDGKPLNPEKSYRVATIDYLANGGDYMTGFTRGRKVAQSPKAVFDDLLYYFTAGKGKDKVLSSSKDNRWTLEN